MKLRRRKAERSALPAALTDLLALGLLFLSPISRALEAPEFHLADIVRTVSQGKVTRLDEVIAALPEELKSHWILMNSTRSAQPASEHFPRVILYSPDLYLAFNGNPSGKGYENLEAIQFDRPSGRYEFRRFEFPMDIGIHRPASVSEANPAVCATCHTSGYRPNWETYANWRGALPAEFGFIASRVTDEERSQLNDFFAHSSQNPRYSLLKNANFASYMQTAGAETLENNLVWNRTAYISSWLHDQIRQDSRFRYAAAAALGDCEALFSFLPDSVVNGGKKRWEGLYADTLTHDLNDQGNEPDHSYFAHRVVTNLRYLFETRGISIRSLSFSFDTPYAVEVKSPTYYVGALQELGERDRPLGSEVGKAVDSIDGCAINYSPSRCDDQARATIKSFCGTMKKASLESFK